MAALFPKEPNAGWFCLLQYSKTCFCFALKRHVSALSLLCFMTTASFFLKLWKQYIIWYFTLSQPSLKVTVDSVSIQLKLAFTQLVQLRKLLQLLSYDKGYRCPLTSLFLINHSQFLWWFQSWGVIGQSLAVQRRSCASTNACTYYMSWLQCDVLQCSEMHCLELCNAMQLR